MTATAVLLAAGRGGRLASVCGPFRKPLVDVGGQPIIGYAAGALARVADRFVVVAHPSTAAEMGAAVRAALAMAPDDGRVEVVVQDRPGGVAEAVRQGVAAVEGAAVIACADNLFSGADVERVTAALAPREKVLLAWAYQRLPASEATRFAVLDERPGFPARLVQKPAEPPGDKCWCGPVAVADAGDLRHRIDRTDRPAEGEYEFTEVISDYVAEGTARPVELTGRFYDVGTPESLDAARRYVTTRGN